MLAWSHSVAGKPSIVLKQTDESLVPSVLRPTDVLIKISYCALNPGGSIMMQLCPGIVRAKPAIPEMDFSGIVVKVGETVPESRNLTSGASVFGSIPVKEHVGAGKGALAEYVVLDAQAVCLKPENVSFEQAAGLPIAGCTALALMEAAKLQTGQKVLINGSSGGIGTYVVQMAKEAVGQVGQVFALCSGSNAEMVKSLGADEVIDYLENAPVHEYLAQRFKEQKFDVIIDAYGIQDLFIHCEAYLQPGKPFVTVGVAFHSYSYLSVMYAVGKMMSNSLWPRILGGVNRPYVQVTGLANLVDMQKLATMTNIGKLRVQVDSCWDFDDALEAYERMLSRRAKGKVIIKVGTEKLVEPRT